MAKSRLVSWLVLVALVLAASLGRLALVSYHQLRTPTDLVYEGPNLSTILLIKSGRNPYSPEVYADGPHAFTMYTPAYHYLVSLFPIDARVPYLSGRLVALVGMAGAAAALVARWISWPSLLVRALLVALFFLVSPVTSNTAFLKTDPMALCCAVWAVYLISGQGRWRTIAAAILCAAAFMTKQSYLAAGGACLATAMLNRDQRTTFLTTSAILGLSLAAFSWFVWGKGFWFCIFDSVRNPTYAWQALGILKALIQNAAFVSVVLLLVLAIGTASQRRAGREVFLHPTFLHVLASWALFSLTIPKLGSSTNYVFEPLLASLLWLAHTHDWLLRHAGAVVLQRALAFLALSAAVVELRWGRDYTFAIPAQLGAMNQLVEATQRGIAARDTRSGQPVLNLSYVSCFLASGTPATLNDPFLYKLLWRAGKLDSAPLERALAAGTYRCVLLLPGTPPDPHTDSPALERIMALVNTHYPERRVVSDLELAFPKAP